MNFILQLHFFSVFKNQTSPQKYLEYVNSAILQDIKPTQKTGAFLYTSNEQSKIPFTVA